MSQDFKSYQIHSHKYILDKKIREKERAPVKKEKHVLQQDSLLLCIILEHRAEGRRYR